jgi:2,4-dienoyl-CoA reductase-like NADH-dependent reductase (Old Yellow Enzyme family)
MSTLFSPITIGGLAFANRIAVSPMCQYSAVDGSMTDWHLMHLGTLALSGAGQLVIESTHVTPEGRITPGCAGLWSDANQRAMQRVVDWCRSISPIRIALQIGHAGRKGSAQRPWEGRSALSAAEGAWETLAPSAVPLAPGWPTPRELDRAGMDRIRAAFVAATRRAAEIGVDMIEVHSAHGYLLNEFLSPLANRRTDAYGGPLANRMRYPLEVFEAMRAAWPQDRPIGVRIPGTDYVEGAWGPADAVAYARELQARGAAYVTVSGGGVVLDAKVPVGPAYQLPYAEQVKRETGITTCTVGMITEPKQAEAIVASGRADFVAIARGFLFDPRWPWHAAVALGADVKYAGPYERAHPALWPPGKVLAGG